MAVEPLLATRSQRAFISLISLQAIVVILMVAITFRKVDLHVDLTDSSYKTLPCYLALFALAEIFELVIAFDALRMRNVIQLVGLLLFHLALIVFAALQVEQTRTALVQSIDCDATTSFVTCGGPGTLWRSVQPFLIVAPCVIAGAWVLMILLIKSLYAEFGWAIFHIVGANPKMKTMYRWYQIMICLLKFDFFAFAGVTIQLLILVLHTDSAEFGVTIAAIPVVLVLLVLCGWAVQREIKWLMSVSLVLMLASMSYLYKLVRFYQPSSRGQYSSTRATLTVFTVVAFLLVFATFAVGLRCFADFDRGLESSKVNSLPTKSKYGRGNSSAQDKLQGNNSYTAGIPMGPRISIE